jgi:signal transduction histidine kinase
VPVKQVGFRARLFFILLGFALIPTIVLSAAWELTVVRVLPVISTAPAMGRIAETGTRAISAAKSSPLTEEQRVALDEHQRALNDGLLYAKQMEFLMTNRLPVAAGALALVVCLLLTLIASRVADHLSRNLSRPLSELVGWTATIERGEPLPEGPPRKGAPEFVVLRNRMREMSTELRLGRVRALEAERAAALRDSARQVAHELKNPLTPIRFAISRLRREAPESLRETIDVLEAESRRLEEMAKSFAQFGRLPEGPRAPVDLGEMARTVSRSAVPADREVTVTVDDDVPMVPGHVDALGRALTNVLLNAVEASPAHAPISIHVERTMRAGRPMVALTVRDEGSGITASRLERIWEPYVTHKAGGTGLGLAIVRQTLVAHDGSVEVESTPGAGTTMRLLLPTDVMDGKGKADPSLRSG